MFFRTTCPFNGEPLKKVILSFSNRSFIYYICDLFMLLLLTFLNCSFYCFCLIRHLLQSLIYYLVAYITFIANIQNICNLIGRGEYNIGCIENSLQQLCKLQQKSNNMQIPWRKDIRNLQVIFRQIN